MSPDLFGAPVQVGDVVAGKYRIERLLGSGGMGVVMAATHLALNEPVALKFLVGQRAGERESMERLKREARATFRLRSPHTVRVHDVGELPTGHVYIVMELLEGRDLRAELAARGPLPVEDVVRYALQACAALEEAHGLGIVHRDLKPHNLFLAQPRAGQAVVKVLDFGMSKVDPSFFENGPLTLPETTLGTPRYMAPEQWKSATGVDARADLWALGIVMYELLTGVAPLHGVAPHERHARMLAGAIPSPRHARPDIPETLERVVLRCLRTDPSARWPTAVHLATALRDAFPEMAPQATRARVTATGVTAVVPPEVLAQRTATAFAPGRETGARSALPTRRVASESFDSSDNPDDFEMTTEVRAPHFDPGEVPPDVLQPAAAKRVIPSTLRSAEAPPELVSALDTMAQEVTAPMTEMRMPPAGQPLQSPRPRSQAPPPQAQPQRIARSAPPPAHTAPAHYSNPPPAHPPSPKYSQPPPAHTPAPPGYSQHPPPYAQPQGSFGAPVPGRSQPPPALSSYPPAGPPAGAAPSAPDPPARTQPQAATQPMGAAPAHVSQPQTAQLPPASAPTAVTPRRLGVAGMVLVLCAIVAASAVLGGAAWVVLRTIMH